MTFQEKVLLCIFHILSDTLKFLKFYVPAVYYIFIQCATPHTIGFFNSIPQERLLAMVEAMLTLQLCNFFEKHGYDPNQNMSDVLQFVL